MRFSGLILAAVLTAPCVHGQAIDVASTARAVDDHYNQLKTFKGSFAEIYRGPGVSRSESGTVWLKKPGRMRWEYHEPKEKLFLTDSENAYFYVPGERQARKTSLKKIDDIRSPLRYLLGKTKLQKELEHLSLAPDITPLQPGNVVLRGVPKGMTDRITEVVLEVSPSHQIARIVVRGVDDATTDFRFSEIEENVPLADSFFRFTLPPGVQIIRDDQVTQ
ncbi:MAG TPA: outer membrane lipoprotein carrier protein LolA [Candidatus Angelobacter sp.]|nr:outer membrane lipoprotein carrier protein LolA [Candidatus Angelobacter sp.]